jgi:hypothetical protein
MLSIFIAVGIAYAFARKASDKNRNPYVWGVIGMVNFFAAQIVVVFVAFVKPKWFDSSVVKMIGLMLCFLVVGVAYYMLHKLPEPTKTVETDSDLLDSNL